MRPLVVCLMMAGTFHVSTSFAFAQSTLQNLRDEVRQSSSGEDKSDDRDDDREEMRRNRRRHFWDDCDDDDDDDKHGFRQALGQAIAFTLTSPYWLPRGMVADDSFAPGYFARYPYHGGQDGAMAPDVLPPLKDDYSPWLVRIRAEYAEDFDDLSRIGGGLLLDTAPRWGVDTAFDYRRESLALGRHDSLWTGDCNLVYRFAQSSQVQMRSGVGFNWLADASGGEFGLNVTYGGDWFPRDPWIVSAELDWGKLGSATLGGSKVGVAVRY